MEIKKIYFDMDQVLADFNGGARKLCGIDVPDRNTASQEEIRKMFERVNETDHFFDRLDMMPGALEMFNAVYGKYGDRVEILSGIPKDRPDLADVGGDKAKWLRRNLGPDVKANFVHRSEKLNYCGGPDYVLIDDLAENVADWESRGGTAIRHVGAAETMERLREQGIM